MRSSYLLLASLLVFSYASAKAFPQNSPESQDGSSPSPDNDLLDQQSASDGNFVLSGNGQGGGSTTPLSLLNSASEVHEYLVSKLNEIHRMLKGHKSKAEIDQASQLDFEHLPQFQDPIHVGDFTKKYKLADVTFSNVDVRGVKGFKKLDWHTDLKDRTVDLVLYTDRLIITGNYMLSNYFKKTSGPFVVKLVDNVTYHESSIYCRLNQEVDIATSQCGILYGKSENDYKNIGFFTQIFKGAISNPLIDEVLQKVGREIGHKMRPVLLNKLQQQVIGKEGSTMVPGLQTLIRSAVSEVRNLMLKDDYKNFQLEGDAEKIQYGTHDASILAIYLSGISTFEITSLETPVQGDRITVELKVRSANISGSANVMFEENDSVIPKNAGPTSVVLPFDIEDLNVHVVLDKSLSNDLEKFRITNLEVTTSKVTTKPGNENYVDQIATALREFLPAKLKSMISERFVSLGRKHIENILQEATIEEDSSSTVTSLL